MNWFGLRSYRYRRARFRLNDQRPLPCGIALRLYEIRDREACVAVYKENEAGRFPPGFAGNFDSFLDYLKIVLCHQDVVVAIGGIALTPFLASHCALLAFGLVSPAWQGKGLGTALLLARLGLLLEPNDPSLYDECAKDQSILPAIWFCLAGNGT